MERWRLLRTGLADGVTNMAVDEAILEAVEQGIVPPTLRIYGWRPPCISVGRSQPVEEILDLERCRGEGVDVVRRPTGGKAILHAEDFTYSVVIPAEHPLAGGSVLDSYRAISKGLLRALEFLGAPAAEVLPSQEGEYTGPLCFEVPTVYEIECMGRKVIGSAQFRRRKGVLQHGSMQLRGDVAGAVRFLKVDPAAEEALKRALRSRAITLEEALGRPVSFDEVAEALICGFADAFDLDLEPGELSDFEKRRVESLRGKYSSLAWTFEH